MKWNRRELPRSGVAGHRPRLVPHRGFEGSPGGWTHPLLETETWTERRLRRPRVIGRSFSAWGEIFGDDAVATAMLD